ncbi:MAG TPA: hypothetical protein VM238_22540 [Phycisphaerae bacterium]|nr:hypothetical protein [Phycisphaerae bacterium]
MGRRLLLVGIATAAAACAAGCAAPTVRPYRSMHDIERARSQAGLIVQGEVMGTEPLDVHPVANPYPHPLDPLGQIITEYAVRTRVTVRPTEVIKGSADPAEPVSFWLYSPSHANEPDVLLDRSLSLVMTGDKLRVFLERRGVAWWLIAHERWYRKPQPAEYYAREGPPKSHSVRIRYIPAAGAPAGEAGAAVTGEPGTVAPGVPAAAAPAQATAPAPGQGAAAPATPPGIRSRWVREPRERRTRLGDRTTPSRPWPPPRE